MSQLQVSKFRRRRALAFAVLAAAFMVAFFHRVAPAVFVSELMRDLEASAVDVGWLAASYFYVYTAMQIPSGILVDRVGARISVAAGSAVAAAGTWLFASAPGMAMAGGGRLLIGLGVATAFVGIMKFNAAWFSPRQYSTVSGLVVLFGNFGAVLGASPLAFLLTWIDWRQAFFGVAIFSAVLALLIALVVRDEPAQAGFRPATARAKPRLRPSWPAALAAVAANPRVWPHALALFTIIGSFFAFTGLWAVPMFHDVYGLSRRAAAGYVTVALIFFALGSFAAGWISDRLGRRRSVLVAGAILSTVVYLAFLFLPWAPGPGAWLLFAANGLGASAMVVCYTGAKEHVEPAATGMAIAFVNTGLFLGAALLQPAFGWLIEWQAPAAGPTAGDYSSGLGLLCLACALGVAATLRVTETGRR